jgi:transposase
MGVFSLYHKKNRELQSQIQFIALEDLVPQDHILWAIDRTIDFNFIYDEVKDLYSAYDAGRPGIDPVSLFKIVFNVYCTN